MNKSYFGRLSLAISITAVLTSCDQPKGSKYKPSSKEEEKSTTELAREGRFSAWTSKAGLQFQMEHLPGDQYFSIVEGRLKDGANQYRAITETFDKEAFLEWAVFWSLSENELASRELGLLRRGFTRHHAQVFTDSSGIALHQLTMLLRRDVAGSDLSPEQPLALVPQSSDVGAAATADTTASLGSESASLAEANSEEVPDFIKPELRRIDDGPAPSRGSEPTSSDVLKAASVTSIEAGAAPPEVVSADGNSSASESATAEVAETSSPAIVTLEPTPDPEPKVEVKPEPKPEIVKHRVSKGDTLSGIARRYGVSVSAIKRTNGLRSDIIRLRQVLRIPKK